MDRGLRPMGFLALMDEMLHVYKSRFLTLAGIGALSYAPVQLLTLLAEGRWTSLLMCRVLTMIAGTVASTAMVYVASQSHIGRRATTMESYGLVLFRPFAFVDTIIGTAALITIGALVFVIPGVVLQCLYALVGPVFVIEGLTGPRARKRSTDLIRGHWKPILGAYACAYGLQYGITMTVYTIMKNALHAGPNSPEMIVALGIAGSITLPFAAIVATLLYYDIRIRKEGFDVELLARDVEASAETDEMKEPSVTV